MKAKIIFFLTVLISSSIRSQHREKVHVTVLYESLCPDSINFIQTQLKPAYDHLKDFIDLYFVPFGKSKNINNGEYFVCQHGPEECKGNMIQSCALNELNDQTSQVLFVFCQMRPGANTDGKECSESVGITYTNVLNCFNSGIGTELQLEAEKITSQVSPRFIPTILYNHEFNQELQDLSLTNFIGVVCDQISHSAKICST